jgi:hypothetical protein
MESSFYLPQKLPQTKHNKNVLILNSNTIFDSNIMSTLNRNLIKFHKILDLSFIYDEQK